MYLKYILYSILILFFIGCSTSYQSIGVAITKDIYIEKDNNKSISLIVNSFIDEVNKEDVERLIVSDLKKIGYSVSTKKPFLSKKIYVDLIELKSLITTQNSHTSFLNFWFGFSQFLAQENTPFNTFRIFTREGFKDKKKKDFREIPVYILISKIRISEISKSQETKIIAEELESNSLNTTIKNLEKKLSSSLATVFKGKL